MINILACEIVNGNVPTYNYTWELGFKRTNQAWEAKFRQYHCI